MNTSARGAVCEALERFSPAGLTATVALALCIACGIALYAPGWWRAALLAFSVGSAALAGVVDRRIKELREPEASPRLPMLLPLRAVRLIAVTLAILSALSFVVFGVGLIVGSPGAGG